MTDARRADAVEEAVKPEAEGGEVGIADLPLVQAWVPDHRSPEFEARLARQAAAIAGSPDERDVLEWLDQVRDTRGWVWKE